MGWNFSHRDPYKTSLDDDRRFLEREGFRFVDLAKRGRTLYAACRTKDNKIVGVVFLTSWTNDFCNFGYKVVDENMGPVDTNCPKRILDKLDPTTNDWALEWRAKCYANFSPAHKVQKGDFVKFDRKLDFVDGVSEDTFTFVSHSRFIRQGDGRQVNITSWRKNYNYTILQKAASLV